MEEQGDYFGSWWGRAHWFGTKQNAELFDAHLLQQRIGTQ